MLSSPDTLYKNKEAQANIFRDMDDHGKGELKLEKKNSFFSRKKDNKEKLNERNRKKALKFAAQLQEESEPTYALRQAIKNEIKDQELVSSFKSSINNADDLVFGNGKGEFERGLDLYFEQIDESNSSKLKMSRLIMVVFGVLTTLVIIWVLLFVNYGYQDMEFLKIQPF